MRGYNFTERTRKVLALAREEAIGLGHEYIGTEHILLGLIAEGGGIAVSIIRNFRIDPGQLASRLHGALKPGRPDRRFGPDLPFTARGRKVLELALKEAKELGHSYVGTEHVLLGLLREERGIAGQILNAAGMQLDQTRAELLRLLGAQADESPSGGPAGVWLDGATSRRIESVEISLRFDDGEVRQRSFPSAREAAEYLWRGGAS
jgi:ATP-dependent Clp protease ATP-binding subunit ClpC